MKYGQPFVLRGAGFGINCLPQMLGGTKLVVRAEVLLDLPIRKEASFLKRLKRAFLVSMYRQSFQRVISWDSLVEINNKIGKKI